MVEFRPLTPNSRPNDPIFVPGMGSLMVPSPVKSVRKMSPVEPVFYPQDPINGFLQGCLLDLRVRLAIDFLKSHFFSGFLDRATLTNMRVEQAASIALILADEVLKQGAARGWVTSIPEDGEIGPELRAQAKRNALYQVVQQMEANKAAQAEQSSIAVPVAPMPGRKMN